MTPCLFERLTNQLDGEDGNAEAKRQGRPPSTAGAEADEQTADPSDHSPQAAGIPFRNRRRNGDQPDHRLPADRRASPGRMDPGGGTRTFRYQGRPEADHPFDQRRCGLGSGSGYRGLRHHRRPLQPGRPGQKHHILLQPPHLRVGLPRRAAGTLPFPGRSGGPHHRFGNRSPRHHPFRRRRGRIRPGPGLDGCPLETIAGGAPRPSGLCRKRCQSGGLGGVLERSG